MAKSLVHVCIPVDSEDEAQAAIDKVKKHFEHPGVHGWYEQEGTIYKLHSHEDEEDHDADIEADDGMTLLEAYDHFLDHLGHEVIHIEPSR